LCIEARTTRAFTLVTAAAAAAVARAHREVGKECRLTWKVASGEMDVSNCQPTTGRPTPLALPRRNPLTLVDKFGCRTATKFTIP